MLKDSQVPEGTLVWAHEQTGGRGQRGNTWKSEANKNITLSIILKPNLKVDKQFYLTRVISLGMVDFLNKCLKKSGLNPKKSDISDESVHEVKIKWPNDIYAGDKKIAGILIENLLKEDQVNVSIIGIGLNVNQTEFGELIQATSLCSLTGEVFDLKDCIGRLCEFIEAGYLQLKAGKEEQLKKDYTYSLYQLNRLCDYEKAGRIFKAVLTGVNEQGRLLLKDENGETHSYDLKELKFI